MIKERVVVGRDHFSKELANRLGADHVMLKTRVFPNFELNPRIMLEGKSIEGKQALVVVRPKSQEEHDPNAMLVETLLTLKNLKEQGAKPVVVWPWFPYSLQDKVFREGEPSSAHSILDMLHDAGATAFFTVSAHMDRQDGKIRNIEKTGDYYDKMPCYTMSGFKAIAEHLQGKVKNPVVIAPDFTSDESAKEIKAMIGGESAAIHKTRDVDTGATEITTHDLNDLSGRHVVIVDDIANTGGTLAKAIKLCKDNGAEKVVSVVVHPVLAENCLERVSKEGEFIGCDTIDSPISKITVVPALAAFIKGKLI